MAAMLIYLRRQPFSLSASISKAASTTGQRLISKVLIANRGEIACRIMKTAKRLGIGTVAVFSDADRRSLHVQLADEAYHIGPSASQESYLRKDKILDVARRSGCQAIHPGYGFLSENAEFADMCEQENVIFVGPPSSAIRDMGLKNTAKTIMHDAGVPVVLGYHGGDQSDAKLKEESDRIGYPVMLKAVRGGGGKGMRIVMREEDFTSQLESARREAMKSFGNDDMIVEKFVVNPRHVEVQVFGDKHNNYVYLFERDCSVQRRHQKIIEEAPAPGLSEETRKSLGVSACKAAHAVGYVGAGTVEFIMDPQQKFFFMEMNTRLQVEHPVSEMITGFDFVEWQFRVAAGETLPVIDQEKIRRRGHSFEARIYAEDPDGGFMPAAGTLHHLNAEPLLNKENVRVETGVLEGDQVSVHYDPMIAKLVVWGPERSTALKKLDDCLIQYHIAGVKTNVNFLRRLANHAEFQKGNVYTDFIKDFNKDLFNAEQLKAEASSKWQLCQFVAGVVLLDAQSASGDPFAIADQFRVNQPSSRQLRFNCGSSSETDAHVVCDNATQGRYSLLLNGQPGPIPFRVFNIKRRDTSTTRVVEFGIEIEDRVSSAKVVSLVDPDEDRRRVVLFNGSGTFDFEFASPKWLKELRSGSGADDSSSTVAPMPGVVEKVLASPGQSVKEGDALIIMVAMKMEYVIKAPHAGVVDKVLCKAGSNVPKGAQLVTFKEESSALGAK